MQNYPATIPVDAVQAVFSAALNPASADTKVLVAAGYNVLGYVLGQTVGEPDPVRFGAAVSEDLPQMLATVQTPVSNHPIGAVNNTWQLVIAHGLMLAMALLAKEKKAQP